MRYILDHKSKIGWFSLDPCIFLGGWMDALRKINKLDKWIVLDDTHMDWILYSKNTKRYISDIISSPEMF